MDVGHLVVIIGLGVIVVIGVILLPQVWRMEADVQRPEATEWLPLGEALRAGFVRSIPVAVVTLVFLELATTAAFFEDALDGSASDTAGTFTIVFGIPFLLGLVLDLMVTLFNQPKAVVPPAARHEPGALVSWWAHRTKRPAKS